MRVLEKGNRVKKICFLFILMVLLALITVIMLTKREYENYKEQINVTMLGILTQIQKQYPDIKEEEIIHLLNADTSEIEIKKNLEKYGIEVNEVSIIKNLDKQFQKNIEWNLIFMFCVICFLFLIFMFYLKERKKKIEKVTWQIQKINQKDYTLQIQENTEDELSNLRNEIYKTTIMLKEQAENSNKEKESLAESVSDISHQLKTPLTSISIMLDNISENEQMEEETKRKFLHEIRRQIEWINWLIISLLKMAKLDAGAVKFKEEKFLIKDIMENVIQNLAIPIEIKNIQIEQEGKKEVKIQGDFYWQSEALTNILKNAIEHTQENGKIKIEYEENNFYTKIKIQDNGKGISKKDLPHIFERFYKGENASENSVGIGLALSKTIIEKGKGQIRCISEEEKGTIFEIRYMKE